MMESLETDRDGNSAPDNSTSTTSTLTTLAVATAGPSQAQATGKGNAVEEVEMSNLHSATGKSLDTDTDTVPRSSNSTTEAAAETTMMASSSTTAEMSQTANSPSIVHSTAAAPASTTEPVEAATTSPQGSDNNKTTASPSSEKSTDPTTQLSTSHEPESSSAAIGSGFEGTIPTSTSQDLQNPSVTITLLTQANKKHLFKLDEKYLTKRGVTVPGVTENGKKDPFSISIYTLKELILRDWRDEWEPKPHSPSGVRLIYFGRLLEDREDLREYKFKVDAPNVVHLTVKPQDIMDEEESSGGTKSRGAGRVRDTGEERGAGCGRCTIL